MSPLANQCRAKAEEGGFASLMNDTKWRELCMALATFEKKPAWRTRDLLTGYVSSWDSDWYHHVGPDYCSIEWLEIERGANPKEEIRSVLQSVGAPFEETDSCFRVMGYRK
jgi:hypothetical protein